jgi:hypothetical protein
MDLVDQFSRRGRPCGNLRVAARAVSSAYNRHLADAGIQASRAGGGLERRRRHRQGTRRAPCDARDDARTRRIREREGLVALDVGDDRRRRIARLSHRGRSVFAKALVGWKKARSEVADLLDDEFTDTNRVRSARAAWRSRRRRSRSLAAQPTSGRAR